VAHPRHDRPDLEENTMHTRTWHVTINLFEEDGLTRAQALLRTDVGPERRHDASARRHPADRDVPEIGDELAVSRALAGLAHDLLDAAIGDIAANDPASGTPSDAAGSPDRS
jgi:hypothetical protein